MEMSLEEMKNVDVRTVDRDSLVDINTIVIDESLSKEERAAEFLRQIKNPYCCGIYRKAYRIFLGPYCRCRPRCG